MTGSPTPARVVTLRDRFDQLVARPALTPVAAAIVVSVVTLLAWRPLPVGSSQDDGLYVILAKSLATGHGYRFINLPDAPQAVHFPPGYPALLALLWKLWPAFPANAHLFGIVNVLLLGVAAGAAFLIARRADVSAGGAFLAVVAGFLMPPMLALDTVLMSEPLWLALGIPWLLWAERVVARDSPVGGVDVALLGASAGALMLVRTQSVSLIAGLVAVLLLRRRWRDAIIALACAAVIVTPWQIWVSRYAHLIPEELSGKYGAYGAWVGEGLRVRGPHLFLDALARNGDAAVRFIRGMFSVPRLPHVLFLAALIPPTLAGGLRVAQRLPVVFMCLCAHAATILLFPGETQRYVWSSWPFITIWLAAGFAEVFQQARTTGDDASSGVMARRVWRPVGFACLLLVSAGAVASTLVSVFLGSFRDISSFGARQLVPVVHWVQRHAPADAVIASDDETAVYLYTGRRTAPLSVPLASWHMRTDMASPVPLAMIIRRYQPDLVIARWQASVAAAMDMSLGAAPALRPIDSFGTTAVFQRTAESRR